MSSPIRGFATRAIRIGQNPEKWNARDVIPPISVSTTFTRPGPTEKSDFTYSRMDNPTRQCLEEGLASLEEAKYALCFASGLSAILSTTYLLKTGDHILSFDDLYGGTNLLFNDLIDNMGIETTFIDMRDLKNVEDGIKPNTRMVYYETPTNPTMKMVDIEGVSKILEDHPDILHVVDNTFMSPYFQKPLNLGAHISINSLTKYINGHSDVIGGAIATNDEKLFKKMKHHQSYLGAVPSPFDCFLVNRGLKTLEIRMEKHAENARKVAEFLEKHEAVEEVVYPGLKSHPQYELTQKQCTGSSGMVSFYIKGGLAAGETFLKSLKIFLLAVSLGSVESLAEIPSLMTHANMDSDEREKLGITDNFIRLSVGLENSDDLLADLEYALQASGEKYSYLS